MHQLQARHFATLVLALLLVAAATAQSQRFEDYRSQLNNNALVQKQINCILDRGPCDRTGKQIKASIPEVVGRNCHSCTPSQSRNAKRLISFIQQRYPSQWAEIQAKYGPKSG